jgi:hypothetical protein
MRSDDLSKELKLLTFLARQTDRFRGDPAPIIAALNLLRTYEPDNKFFESVIEGLESRGFITIKHIGTRTCYSVNPQHNASHSNRELRDYLMHAALNGSTAHSVNRTPAAKTSRPCVVLPRLWALFPFILPRNVRERVYEPAHQEVLEEYIKARKYRTKWAGRWITFAFTIKTIRMVCQSLNACIGDQGRKIVKWIALALLGGAGLQNLRAVFFELVRRL